MSRNRGTRLYALLALFAEPCLTPLQHSHPSASAQREGTLEDSLAVLAFVAFALLVGGFVVFHAIVLFVGQIDPDAGYGESRRKPLSDETDRRAEPCDGGVALWRDDDACDRGDCDGGD